jgi:hypothetical protein
MTVRATHRWVNKFGFRLDRLKLSSWLKHSKHLNVNNVQYFFVSIYGSKIASKHNPGRTQTYGGSSIKQWSLLVGGAQKNRREKSCSLPLTTTTMSSLKPRQCPSTSHTLHHFHLQCRLCAPKCVRPEPTALHHVLWS